MADAAGITPLSAAEAADASHWLSLAKACVANGDDLLSDAQLLADHDRVPRALSLSVLAREEYGKAAQALAVIWAGGDAEEKDAYRRLQAQHRPKLEAATVWSLVVGGAEPFDEAGLSRAEAEVHKAADTKMAGFYVDRSDDGVRTPSEILPSQAARYLEQAKVTRDGVHHAIGAIPSDSELHALWRFGPVIKEAIAAAGEGAGATDLELMNSLRGLLTKFGLPLDGPGEAQGERMHFLGVDLAWGDGGHPNETGLVYADPDGVVLAAGWTRGVDETVAWIDAQVGAPNVLAFVDAPLIVTNATGQRLCERQVGQCYGRWLVSANSTNTTHPNAAGAALLARMRAVGWVYDSGTDGPARSGRRISECYPYTTLVGAHEFGYDIARPTYKRKPRGLGASHWRATRAAVCDDLIVRLAKLAQAEPRLDLSSHPVTAALLLEPSPLDDGAYKHREDLIDAALCAWTARLWSRYGFTKCQVLGGEDGEPALAATIIAPSKWDQRLASVSTALPSHA